MPKFSPKNEDRKRKTEIDAMRGRYLAESVSKSGTGNTGSDDDNVAVAVGSAFSISGLDAFRRGLGIHSSVLIVRPRSNEQTKRNHGAQRGRQDPTQRTLIHHFSKSSEQKSSQRSPRRRRRRRRRRNFQSLGVENSVIIAACIFPEEALVLYM